jgi:hypothetical protein
MDSLVHIFYEVAGTAGAFCTALALIPQLGNNYSFVITPIFFTAAAVIWWFVDALTPYGGVALKEKTGLLKATFGGFFLFFESVYTGGKILFSSRKFFWLLPAYSIALYTHRYLENAIAPAIARRYLGNSAWSQLMVAGSNIGSYNLMMLSIQI